MNDESIYDEWIAGRRSVEPSPELADRVMAAVEQERVQSSRRVSRSVSIAGRIDHSLPARCAACVAAILVGSFPFLYVAYVAKLIVL